MTRGLFWALEIMGETELAARVTCEDSSAKEPVACSGDDIPSWAS